VSAPLRPGSAADKWPATQPKTLAHAFALLPLRTHFANTPNPAASNRLIDLPSTEFIDTEEEINVIAGALYLLAVAYDELEQETRPKDVEGIRKWIVKHRPGAVGRLAGKVEPPFCESTGRPY
jgi:hypothetical protein